MSETSVIIPFARPTGRRGESHVPEQFERLVGKLRVLERVSPGTLALLEELVDAYLEKES
jgi:hypothetical protein